MRKPDGYDESPAYTGETEQLSIGGHVCVIKGVKEENHDYGDVLILRIDIAEGEEFAGFYQRQFERQVVQNPDAKWKGIFRQMTTDKGTPFFKGMITSIEESNPGFKFNFDEKTLIGKKFGGVFGREQFEAKDGSLKLATKCRFIRSVKAVRDGVDPPEDKLISNTQTGLKEAFPPHNDENMFF